MHKGTHFIGQPMYGELLNLLDKSKILTYRSKKIRARRWSGMSKALVGGEQGVGRGRARRWSGMSKALVRGEQGVARG